MRVAIVSDIHGNLTAFDAVVADIGRQAPDVVLHGGDLVLMGAQPAEVIDRVRELGWEGVVGNTDEVLWRPDEQQRQQARAPKLGPLLRLFFEQYAPATERLLGEERVAGCASFPPSSASRTWCWCTRPRTISGGRPCPTPTIGSSRPCMNPSMQAWRCTAISTAHTPAGWAR